ncbi:MAG: hypothetical protein WAW39_25450 [Prosthecobacter sp.]|uniref:hypothetical protein n=1 Tax=Prosthecobacter sp. TaxID=1965333 RepID=UPI003BAEAB2B
MSTVLEIEQAIETLPREQWLELRAWFMERDATISASASVFALFDAEEGAEQQWQD